MELNNTLEEWLQTASLSGGNNRKVIDYYTNYNAIKKYLIQNVYPHVTPALNFNDSDENMYYNDHGELHVETVIERASELAKSEYCELNEKEVYFLLCAILIHDIGNIFGRVKHESRHEEVISHIITIFSTDTAEQNIILEIARAHGGRTQRGSKDTISELLPEKHYGNIKVRTRLLSSILRFADELADDRTRSSSELLSKGLLNNSPSEIFHAYSACVDSVLVEHEINTIIIQYNIPLSFIQRKFKKFNSECYIIDEIYQRLEKIHTENVYCQKYIAKFIPISKVEVNIDFIRPYNQPFSQEFEAPQVVNFSIENKGYPNIPNEGIFELCPTLKVQDTKLDGEYYFNKFSRDK